MSEKALDYAERKFIVTILGIVLGTAALGFGAVVPNINPGYWSALPAYFILLGTGITAYNWANLRQSQNGHAPR